MDREIAVCVVIIGAIVTAIFIALSLHEKPIEKPDDENQLDPNGVSDTWSD